MTLEGFLKAFKPFSVIVPIVKVTFLISLLAAQSLFYNKSIAYSKFILSYENVCSLMLIFKSHTF